MRVDHLVATIMASALAGCSNPDQGPTGKLDAGADAVWVNGRIYTVNEARPWAESVAVDGDEIVYVGDSSGAQLFVGEDTQQFDLEGGLVLPGFIESHIHLALGSASMSGVLLDMGDSIEGVLEKVAEYAAAHPEKKTIFGASYNAALFDDKGPDKRLLDEVVPDRPVYLLDHTMHSVWVNSRSLEMAGITRDTVDPVGGEYIRDENGEATGAIKGAPAHVPVSEAIDAVTAESMRGALPTVLEGLTEFGFTTAMDMGTPIATEAAFEAMVGLDKAGELPLRVSMTHYINTAKMAETASRTLDRYAKQYRSNNVWIDTLKITIDSVIENQKAAMLEPYDSTGDSGTIMFDHEQMKAMVLDAAGLGYHVTVHCIGDRAVREALDAAQALREAGFTNTRFSTTHTQMVDPADRSRFIELDVAVQATGNWAVRQRSYVQHLGELRNETLQFPFRTWADSGVVIALGADWPATPGGFDIGVNPFNNIYCAMHRIAPKAVQTDLGSYDEPLPPLEEVLTLEEAVAAYTLGGARMLGIQKWVGSIEVGKKADMILLDRNIFEIDAEEIPKTKVLSTMMGGTIYYDVEN